MEKLYTELLAQFPILGVIFVVAFFITRYIKESQLECNTRYETSESKSQARYDAVNAELKAEMKENSKTLADLSNRTIQALDKSIEVCDNLQARMTTITENQVLIIAQITKNK